jgi:hypothetical protein
VLSAALICLVAGWAVFQILPRRSSWQMRLFAATFAAALPTSLYNFSWTWLARVDTLAILLAFSGVVLLATRVTSVPAQILAAVFMTAGLFTRQTVLAAPLACLLVSWLIDRKIALRMLLTMFILGGGALAFLTWWSHGQALLHLFRYNQNPFSIQRAAMGLLMNARYVAGLLVLAAGASWTVLNGASASMHQRRWDLLAANLRVNRYRRGIFLLALYSMLAGLSALAFGKEGADINYFLEWNVSLVPLAGVLLFRAAPGARDLAHLRPPRLAALAIPLLLLNAGFDQARTGWLRVFGPVSAADQQRRDVFDRALAAVKAAPGRVFSEDMNLLNQAGKEIPADPVMIQCLAVAGMWDERPFLRLIQERSFSLIVAYDLSSRERYSPAVAAAIERAYQETKTIGDYRFYSPRPVVSDASGGASTRP